MHQVCSKILLILKKRIYTLNLAGLTYCLWLA